MGYSTDFSGEMSLSPPLNEHERSYLRDFIDTRHTSTEHGLLDVTAGPYVRGNDPQGDKPGIWCHWIADEDGNLVWDEGEKTYDHEQWLVWLIEHLFGPEAHAYVNAHLSEDPRLAQFTCDHVVAGEVDARGEEPDDMWRITATDNDVHVQHAEVTYVD